MRILTSFRLGCFLTTAIGLLVQALADRYTPTNSWTCTFLYTIHYASCIMLAYYSCLGVYWITLRSHATWCLIKGYTFEYYWQDLGEKAWGWPYDFEVISYDVDGYMMHLLFGPGSHLLAIMANIAGKSDSHKSPLVSILQCIALWALFHLVLIAIVWLGEHTPSSGFATFVLPSLFAITAAWYPSRLSPISLTWPSSEGEVLYFVAEVLVVVRVYVLVLLGGLIANQISYAAEIAWCWVSGLSTSATRAGHLQGNRHRVIVHFIYAMSIMLLPHVTTAGDNFALPIVKIDAVFAALYCFATLVMLAMFDTFPVGERRKEREQEYAIANTCGSSWY